MKKFIVATVLVAALLALQFAMPRAGGVVYHDRFTYACTGATTALEIYRAPTVSGNEWASTFFVYVNFDSVGGSGAIALTAKGGINSAEACTETLTVITPGAVGTGVVQSITASRLYMLQVPNAYKHGPTPLPPYVALLLTVNASRTGYLDFQVIAGSP